MKAAASLKKSRRQAKNGIRGSGFGRTSGVGSRQSAVGSRVKPGVGVLGIGSREKNIPKFSVFSYRFSETARFKAKECDVESSKNGRVVRFLLSTLTFTIFLD